MLSNKLRHIFDTFSFNQSENGIPNDVIFCSQQRTEYDVIRMVGCSRGIPQHSEPPSWRLNIDEAAEARNLLPHMWLVWKDTATSCRTCVWVPSHSDTSSATVRQHVASVKALLGPRVGPPIFRPKLRPWLGPSLPSAKSGPDSIYSWPVISTELLGGLFWHADEQIAQMPDNNQQFRRCFLFERTGCKKV